MLPDISARPECPSVAQDETLISKVAIDQPNTAETTFLSLTYVTADAARNLLPTYLQRFVKIDPTRDVLAITAPTGPREQIVAQINRLDIALAPGKQGLPEIYRTHIVKLSYAKVATTLALLPAALVDYVRADEITTRSRSARPSRC